MIFKYVQYVAIGSALLSGCFWVREGNGHRVRETRELPEFSRIDVDGSFDVTVEQGEQSSVRVSIDSNLIRFVRTHVVGDTLHIDSAESLHAEVSGPHVSVVTPRLERASLTGSGLLVLRAIEGDEPLELELDGSGDVSFEGSAPEISVRVDGSGTVALAGETERVVLRLSGSGEIDAEALDASRGTIDLEGSGDIAATVHDEVDVSLAGSGNIDLYGGADIAGMSHSGSGDVQQHSR